MRKVTTADFKEMNRLLENPPPLFLSTLHGLWSPDVGHRHQVIAELLGVAPALPGTFTRLEHLKHLLAAWNPGRVDLFGNRVVFDALQEILVVTPATIDTLVDMAVEYSNLRDLLEDNMEAMVLALALAYRVHLGSHDFSVWGIAKPPNPA